MKYAASIENSPCAKFTTPAARISSTKPRLTRA